MRLAQSSRFVTVHKGCLLYTSDAADERSSVDLGGRRIIKKKKRKKRAVTREVNKKQQEDSISNTIMQNDSDI